MVADPVTGRLFGLFVGPNTHNLRQSLTKKRKQQNKQSAKSQIISSMDKINVKAMELTWQKK